MKKKALITYMENRDFKAIGKRQAMLKELSENFKAEGKEFNMESHFSFGSISTFTDGSEIVVMPIGALKETKALNELTHVYLEKSLADGFPLIGFFARTFPTVESVQYFDVQEGSIKLT